MLLKKVLFFILLLLGSSKGWAQLTAAFSADRVAGCAPIRVVYTNESAGSPTSYRWDLGNGNISTSKDPSTTYFAPGTYTIKLTIYKGTDSAVITKTNFITVYGIPVVNFSASPLIGCAPMPVQFTDASSPGSGTITNRQWDFGDGFLGVGANPIHSYKSAGTFRVTLTVTNNFGCSFSDSRFNYITAYDSLISNFGVIAPANCVIPATFRFVDSSLGPGITSWRWDFGDGDSSNQRNPSHTYANSGTYDVRLTIRNSNGCTATRIKMRVVNAGNNQADFTGPVSVCLNKPVTFVNTSQPGNRLDSAKWFFSNGTSFRGIDGTATFTALGTYDVKLVSYFGGCKDSITKSISVLPATSAAFTASPTGACRAPLTVRFTNATPGGTVVKWFFGNGDSSTANNPVYTYRSQGVFDVTLIIRNPSGCLDTLVMPDFIKVQPPRLFGISGLPYLGCFPWTNKFVADGSWPEAVASYEWDFGDGTTSTAISPTHTYPDTGYYTVKLKITTVSGCTDTISSFVQGGLKPKANFVADPRIVCPMDEVSYTDLSTGRIDSWDWAFGDGGKSSEKDPKYRYNDTGSMTVTLIIGSRGCKDTISFDKYIYVKPPIARFNDSVVCSNQFAHYFTDNSVGATYWKWFIGTDSFETRDLNYTFKDTGAYYVRLYVSDTSCFHETGKTIYVLNEKANFTIDDSSSCLSTIKKFTVQGPNTHSWNIKGYRWDFGSGRFVTRDSNVVVMTYTTEGIRNMRLAITDLNDCSDTIKYTLNVKFNGPKVNFTPPVSFICAGNPVTFTDSTQTLATNPIKQWKWNFGDGSKDTIFTSPPFNHIYKRAGVYDVKLSVIDDLGCRDSLLRPKAVIVYEPKADFYSPDTIICVNAPVKFFNRSTGRGLRSAWEFGNGLKSTLFEPQTRYPVEGFYDVKLIVTDSLNCVSELIKPRYIMVADAKAAFAVSDSFTTCPPLLVNFTNSSTNSRLSSWDFGNGNSSSLDDPAHTFTTPGNFMVKLKVTGNGGCTDSAYKPIIIQGPSGVFRYGPLTGCPPLKVDFVSNAINTKVITWDFSDGESTVTTDSITSHIYNVPGDFVPKVIFSDDIGCKLPILGPDTIRLKGAKANIKSLPKYSYCDTTTVAFFDSTITNDIITFFEWNFGDGQTSSDRNPTHFYGSTGNYQVTFEVRTQSGCVSRDTLPQPIIVAPTPILNILDQPQLCVPVKITFQGVWANADTSKMTWQWNFGNGGSSPAFNPPVETYTRTGTYPISLIGQNRYGCADTVLSQIVVNDTPRIVAGPAAYLCLGDQAVLTTSGGRRYIWDTNLSLSCQICPNPIARPVQNQIYRVTGIDSNGCRSTDTVLIRVKPPASLSVGPGDTLCLGESFELKSSGTERFAWTPTTGLAAPGSPNTRVTPIVGNHRYMVIGYDTLGCFYDTGYIDLVVYPIPKFDIVESRISAPTGTVLTLATTSSIDINRWRWSPPYGLTCIDCPEPTLTVTRATTYTANVSNQGGCIAADNVTIVPTCTAENIYIPNTFSPNGDGQNDLFYPRGRGIAGIKSMMIFNRWGQLMYERKDFAINDPSVGWNGSFNGKALTPDVYVYMIDVVCENNVVFNLKGNVTLLK